MARSKAGKTKAIDPKIRAMAYVLRKNGTKMSTIAKKLHISVASVYRCWKDGEMSCKGKGEKREKICKGGRPKKLSARTKARFIRQFSLARKENVNVKVMDVVKEAELEGVASYRTFARILNCAGFKHLQPRKKGLLSYKDKQKRLQYARKMLRQHRSSFWTEDVAMYLDGVSFVHKFNPFREAKTPNGRVWRRASEGLQCTTKGSKNLPGGRRVYVLVGIKFGVGVTLVKTYKHMTGEYFAEFVKNDLGQALRRGKVKDRKARDMKYFVMDNDPCQKSAAAKSAIQEIGANVVEIPPRSPDLNPIENVFHNVRRQLRKQALEQKLVNENFAAFEKRVVVSLKNFSRHVIDRTIENMDTRLKAVVQNKGNRTKY